MNMKLKLTLIFVVFIVSLSLLACSPAVKETAVEVSCDDFYQQTFRSESVVVPAGGSFTVTLCTNPTTGFQWSENAQIGDPTVLEQVDHKLVVPQSEPPPPPGTPSQEIWTFRALKEGESTIYLEYSRPWEGGEKGVWTFTLTTTVK